LPHPGLHFETSEIRHHDPSAATQRYPPWSDVLTQTQSQPAIYESAGSIGGAPYQRQSAFVDFGPPPQQFTYPGQRELSVSHQTNASPQSLKYEAADSTGGYTGQLSQYSQPYHRPPASLVEGDQDFSSPCFTPFRSPSEQEGSFGSSGLLTGSSHREDSLAGKIGHSGSTISNHSQASSHWQPASIRDRPADTKEQLPVSMHCERLFPSGKPVH